jgi:Tol biopolymer transport system component
MSWSKALLFGSVLLAVPAFAGEVRFDEEGHAYHPVWSVDGKWVAFEVNRYAGDVDLFMSEVTGAIAKDAVRVKLPASSSSFGGSGVVAANPVWHNEGFAVFEGSNQGGKYRVYYAMPGGAAPLELLPTTKVPGNLTFPTLSADGNTLGFVTDQSGDGDVRGWNRTNDQFTSYTTAAGSESFPMFSKDGKSLIYSRKQDHTEDIYVVDLTTMKETRVVGGGGDQSRPVYAAGNKVVFFTSERGDGKWDLAVVDTPGGTKRTLAKDVKLPHRARPALSPDGNWVAFVYDEPSKADAITLVKVDGSATVTIPTEFKAVGEPALSLRDGRMRAAFTALPQSGSDWRFLYVIDITGKF